jgi:hypothetical protein
LVVERISPSERRLNMCLEVMDRTKWPKDFHKSGVKIPVWKVLSVYMHSEKVYTPERACEVSGPVLEAIGAPQFDLLINTSVDYPLYNISRHKSLGPCSYSLMKGGWLLQTYPAAIRFIEIIEEKQEKWWCTNLQLHGGAIHCFSSLRAAQMRYSRCTLGRNLVYIKGVGLSDDLIAVGNDGDIAFTRVKLREINNGSNKKIRAFAKELLGL